MQDTPEAQAPTVEGAAPSGKRHLGQICVALGVFGLGVFFAIATQDLPEASGYAKVGPRLMPTIVSIGLLVLGALLIKEALFGGFKDVDEAEAAANPTDWQSFAWITAGVMANGILMVHAGFVISGTLLFVLAARGFGSTKWVKNAIIGLVISIATYAFFNYGLGLGLPAGVLPW